tara:strand:+ start:587 stop:736 length:150 start_codon:yes stop_codon:yes gene_type:complete
VKNERERQTHTDDDDSDDDTIMMRDILKFLGGGYLLQHERDSEIIWRYK